MRSMCGKASMNSMNSDFTSSASSGSKHATVEWRPPVISVLGLCSGYPISSWVSERAHNRQEAHATAVTERHTRPRRLHSDAPEAGCQPAVGRTSSQPCAHLVGRMRAQIYFGRAFLARNAAVNMNDVCSAAWPWYNKRVLQTCETHSMWVSGFTSQGHEG